MTIDETARIMMVIENESKGFMPVDKTNQKLKLDTWHAMLKTYDFEYVQTATIRMLARFTYGTSPKIGDLFKVLQPEKEKQDLGIEFADFVFKNYKKLGLETKQVDGNWVQAKTGKNCAELAAEKFGEQYRELAEDYVAEIKAAANVDDLPFMKSRLSKRFNSEHEREVHNKNYLTNTQATNLLEQLKGE